MAKSFRVDDLVKELNTHREFDMDDKMKPYHIKKTERWDWQTDFVFGWGGVYEIERGHNGPIIAILEYDLDEEDNQHVNGFLPTDEASWLDVRIILDITGWRLPNLGGRD